MSDVFSKAKRSEVMARIRSRGNRDTELAVVALFRTLGITGWRRQILLKCRSSRGDEALTGPSPSPSRPISDGASSRRLPRVRADFVFRQARLAVFVDGCFWHGCPKHCKYAKWLTRTVTADNPPSPRNGLRRTGRAFWRRKLEGNQARDRLVNRALRRAGWRVLRIWEHELVRKNQPRLARRIQRVLAGD